MDFSIGGAFSGAMEHMKERFGLKMGTAALFTLLPSLALFAIIFALSAGSGFEELSAIEAENPAPFSGIGVGMAIGLIVFYIVYIVVTVLGQSVLAALMDKSRANSFGDAMRMAVSALPGLTLAIIIGGVVYMVVFGGLSLLMVSVQNETLIVLFPILMLPVLFYLLTRFSITLPVMVLEGVRNPITAFGRAWSLTGLNQWRLLGYFLLWIVLLMGLYIVFAIVVGGAMGIGAVAAGAGANDPESIGMGMIGIGILFFAILIPVMLALTVLQLAVVVSAYQQFVGTASVADTFD